MLQWIISLVLASSVLLNMVAAPPAAAMTTKVLITHVQAGAAGGAAAQELVAVYNNSSQEIDITGWCIANKSSTSFACISSELPGQTVILPGFSYAVVVSQQFMLANPDYQPAVIYTPGYSSYGSITGGGDSLSIYDSENNLVDYMEWTKPLPGGSLLQRSLDPESSSVYVDTGDPTDFAAVTEFEYPEDGTYKIDIDQTNDCEDTNEICNEHTEESPGAALIFITEILPNVKGSDKGHEFVEIYNPGDITIDLSNYLLWIGTDKPKSYVFPSDHKLEPGQYQYFGDQQIGYTLPNSTSKVWITDKNDNIVSESETYVNPKDDMAWAFINGSWQYTNQPTPGAENMPSIAASKKSSAKSNQLKPCATNQYRSPETNRCRKVEVASSGLKPCQSGQERNPDTNRCRKIATASAQLAECPAGKIRNPETNRCKTEIKMPQADHAVKGDKVEAGDSNWYIWAVVAVAVTLGLSYAAWEWRYEVKSFIGRFSKVLVRKK